MFLLNILMNKNLHNIKRLHEKLSKFSETANISLRAFIFSVKACRFTKFVCLSVSGYSPSGNTVLILR